MIKRFNKFYNNYYCSTWHIILYHMIKHYTRTFYVIAANSSRKIGKDRTFPSSLCQPNIAPISKLDKVSMRKENYWQTSLMNVDVKLLYKKFISLLCCFISGM